VVGCTPGIVVEVMLVELVDGMFENPSAAVGVLGFRVTISYPYSFPAAATH